MLTEIDRVQLAVPDRQAALAGWTGLLGAVVEAEDRVAPLAARRTRLRLGRSRVEIIEPDGAGPLADAVARRGAHLFAAGVATPDLARLLDRLQRSGVAPAVQGTQLFLSPEALGIPGLRLVVSPADTAPPAGAADYLYEATLLTADVAGSVARLADLFALDRTAFVPIASDTFGYAGTLTLFDPAALHRFEIIAPTDAGKTMGRYFARWGAGYYMAFAETARLRAIEARARESGAGLTVDRPAGRAESAPADQMWLHPPALGGMMLGLSRPTMAWSWSGRPDRVAEVAP